MFKKTVFFLSMLCGVLVNLSVMAGTPKTYPPYPNIWGYDLSILPAMKYGSAGMRAYLMYDGDIWFLITKSYDITPSFEDIEKRSNYKYILLKFFKNEKIELSQKKYDQIINIIDKQKSRLKSIYDTEINFSDGSKLQFVPNYTAAKCFFPDFYNQFLLKTDPKGDQRKISILGAHPSVKMIKDGRPSDRAPAPFFYQKLYLLSNIVPLKDDTFLLFEEDGSLILRLNKNLETKFKPITPVRIQDNYIMRNFFVIDYSVIEALEKEYPGNSIPFYQNIHDGLLSYFHKKYNQ